MNSFNSSLAAWERSTENDRSRMEEERERRLEEAAKYNERVLRHNINAMEMVRKVFERRG